MSEYRNLRVIGGWVIGNPINEWGLPYINQWLPIRRATLLERLFALFGVQPSSPTS